MTSAIALRVAKDLATIISEAEKHGTLSRLKTVAIYFDETELRAVVRSLQDTRGNYEDRHPKDDVLWSASDLADYVEVVELLGLQESDKTVAETVREMQAKLELPPHS